MTRATRHVSVRARLIGIAAVGAVFTLVVGAVGLAGYSRITEVNTAEVKLGEAQTLVLRASMSHRQMRAEVWFAYALAADGTSRDRADARQEFDAATSDLRSTLAGLGPLAEHTPYADEIQAIVADETQLLGQAQASITGAFTDRAAGLREVSGFEEKFDQLDGRILELSDLLTTSRAAGAREAAQVRREGGVALFAAVLLALVVLLSLSLTATRSIVGALRRLGEVANRISEGDLEARSDVERYDEIGTLARAFNRTADTLRGMVRQLAAEAQRDGFGNQLAEAFEMVDREPDSYRIIEQAMRIVGPENPTELLLADSSRANLARRASHPEAGAPCCPVKSPFSCVAVRRGTAAVFEDSEALNACPKLKGRKEGALSAVCVPVTFMGRAIGVLHSTGPQGVPADPERTTALSTLAGQAGTRIGTLRSFERAQLQATTDGLTGMLNRRAFETEARYLVQDGRPFTLVMADLDHFKALNDTQGHEAGDRALRVFAQAVSSTLRGGDITGRIGGEEFALILRDVATTEAAEVLERLRGAVFDATAGNPPAFTVSFGLTDTYTTPGGLDALMRVADTALYRAKAEGRDRVVIADERELASASAGAPPVPHTHGNDDFDEVDTPMHRAVRDDDPMDRMSPIR
jgi:diguanylate cyclase (GGDEF)-like protein